MQENLCENPNPEIPITLCQDTKLWKTSMLPMQYLNSGFPLFVPNLAMFGNAAENLFTEACYLQPNCLLHGQAPWEQQWGSPASPSAAEAPLLQDTQWGSAKRQFPYLGACEPLPWTSCLISELTQTPFSVTTLSGSNPPLWPYYHQHLQLINVADLGPQGQKFLMEG